MCECKNDKTIWLYVWSDDNPDFGALSFEEKYDINTAYKMVLNDEKFYDENDNEIFVEILEFGLVDTKFVDFLKQSGMLDYDSMKSSNIYQVIEDTKNV